ncbi:hypothetical protein K8942_01655 [Candidatus Peribacteria bacterium]|nr:MAG: hypothetical protein K8942_01655 [Candidatus Peribacteria bacterium]
MSNPPKKSLSQTTATQPSAKHEAKKSLNLPKAQQEKVAQKRQAKKSILEDAAIFTNLEVAFRVGATQAQAALHAGCSLTALKNHLRDNTMMDYKGSSIGFTELVEMWKGSLVLKAKMRIADAMDDKKTGVDHAKWVLERLERHQYSSNSSNSSADDTTHPTNSYEVAMRGVRKLQSLKASMSLEVEDSGK